MLIRSPGFFPDLQGEALQDDLTYFTRGLWTPLILFGIRGRGQLLDTLFLECLEMADISPPVGYSGSGGTGWSGRNAA